MSKQFFLPELGYAFNALEPVIDARTMELHHDKHHASYVSNLNKALENAPEFFERDINDILRNITQVPENIRTAVRNQGGGHANHTLFWQLLTPGGAKSPSGKLLNEINLTFGSFDSFVEKLSNLTVAQFGSGWGWLVVDSSGKLQVYSTSNQDSPILQGHFPLIGIDVWEHAYYLQYQNRRADYVKAIWQVLNWNQAEKFYANAS